MGFRLTLRTPCDGAPHLRSYGRLSRNLVLWRAIGGRLASEGEAVAHRAGVVPIDTRETPWIRRVYWRNRLFSRSKTRL